MIDILIAGAGPAGAVAATILARAGARVVVLDRARFPRDKLCGDSVNPGAIAILQRLGLEGAIEGGLPIEGMVVTGGGATVEGRYGDARGRTLTRRVLDERLVLAAAAAGAAIEQGVLVDAPVVNASGAGPVVCGLMINASGTRQTMRAALVIAADGRHSRVARHLGLSRAPHRPRRWAVGGYFTGVTGLRACGEMHIRAGHYIGVAPLPGGLANACVVTSNRELLRDPAACLLNALHSDAGLAARFAGAEMQGTPVSMGPLAVEAHDAGMPGLLLAGDAAGFVDPMTGDGLRLAFRGAELAAAEALRALEHGPGDAHLRLARARRAAFARKVRFNRTLRALVASPFAVRAAGAGAALAPGLLRAVIRYAGDLDAV